MGRDKQGKKGIKEEERKRERAGEKLLGEGTLKSLPEVPTLRALQQTSFVRLYASRQDKNRQLHSKQQD